MSTNRFIGITGGIGCGKSTVSRFWSFYAKLPLIDVDQLCRELFEREMPGWVALKANFGELYFNPDGQLDRAALRSALFDDEELRKIVDQLIHPLALDLLHEKSKAFQGDILVDVPLLYEAGWGHQFKRTVVVYADQQICCQRICRRDRILPGDAVKAISAQMRIDEKAMRADHVIDNRYCWLLTRMQVSHLAGLVRNDCSAEFSGRADFHDHALQGKEEAWKRSMEWVK